ncbi:hypothetical protein G6F31_014656 [Rhizopus arrhizus]|nr:hypothetical protein G6F31_014656 [Rhizopus arrhizus]
MRAARARQQRMARAHVVLLSIQHVAALPADDVVDLILVLRVQADAGALVQHPLAQHERQIRRASEERIRGGRPCTTVRAGLRTRNRVFVQHLRGPLRIGALPCARHIAVDVTHQRRLQRRQQRHRLAQHQAGHRIGTGHAEVCAVGLVLLGHEQELRPRALLAQRADPACAAVVELDQRDVLARRQLLHRQRVARVRVQQ